MHYDRDAHLSTHDHHEEVVRRSGRVAFAGGREAKRGGRECARDYYFAHDELLVHAADLGLLRELGVHDRRFEEVAPPGPLGRPAPEQRDLPGRPAIRAPEPRRHVELPFVRLRRPETNDAEDLLAVLRDLRATSCERYGREIRVGLNHVLAAQKRFGSPAGPADPHDPIDPPAGDAGSGVTIAVLDTAMSDEHAWLKGQVQIVPGSWETATPAATDWSIYTGHATFIAGVVRRIAPGARILGIQVLNEMGFATDASIAAALLDAVALGAQVVNLSLGGYAQPGYGPVALGSVIERVGADVAIVAAAGNKPDGERVYPAAMKRVYAVGALDAKGARASFSNFGTWIDACATGEGVVSSFYSGTDVAIPADPNAPKTFDGYAAGYGTSFAAPQLAAAIAVEMACAGLSPHEAAARVLARGIPVPDLGRAFAPSL